MSRTGWLHCRNLPTDKEELTQMLLTLLLQRYLLYEVIKISNLLFPVSPFLQATRTLTAP